MKILDQIDQFLDNQKENEAKLFFVLPILLFGFLSWYFIYPITDKGLNQSINKNNQLHNDINTYTNQIYNFKLGNANLNRKIYNIKNHIKQLNKEQMKYNELVKKLKFLRFDLVSWAKFYKNIPFLAKNHHIIIYQLDNNMNIKKTDKLVQKKMTITLQVTGSFINFVKFMMEFEKLKEFVKIVSIDMSANNMKLTIEIYGAQL